MTATIADMMQTKKRHPATRAAASRGSCLTRLLIGLLILSVGFIIGGLTAAYMVSTKTLETLQNPQRWPALATYTFKRNYNLSDAQTEQVREIFQERYERGVWMTYRMWPVIDASLDDLAGDLRGVLDEEQTERFNDFYKKLRTNVITRPEKPEDPPKAPWNWFDLGKRSGATE